MPSFLDFEKPIAELQGRIDELRDTAAEGSVDLAADIARLQAKSDKLLKDTFARLTPWQKTQVARHPERPHFKDYVAALFGEFVPLAGDRAPEVLPQSWDDARDTAFFTLTARLFSPATALAMTVLLASYDDDAAPVAADGRG